MKGRIGILFVCLLVLLFVPEAWIQISVRFLLAAGIASYLIGRHQKNKLTVEVEFPVYRLFAHERQDIVLRVANNSRFPLEVVGFFDEPGGLHPGTPSSGTLELRPLESSTFSWKAWSERRGLYALGPCHVAGHDPLGIFPWEETLLLHRKVIVFPRIIPADLALARGITGNQKHSTRVEHQDPLETRATRPWLPGDELRSIHWKQTARTGVMMVKEHPLMQDVPYHLVLNLRAQDYHAKRKQAHMERCIEAAAAFMVEAHNQGILCHFTSNGQASIPVEDLDTSPPFGTITAHLETLALLEGSESSPPLLELFSHLHVTDRPHLVLVSPPLKPEDFAACSRLLGRLRSLVWIVLDELQERTGDIGLQAGDSDKRIKVWRLQEHSDQLEAPRNA